MSDANVKDVKTSNESEQRETNAESTTAEDKDTNVAETTSTAKEEKSKNVTISELMKRCNFDMGDWAEMTENDEKYENKRREDVIRAELGDCEEPFIILASNLADYVTPEDVYFFFGGDNKVKNLYFCSPPNSQTLEVLVELTTLDAMVEAIMLKKTDLYKRKVDVEYVDLTKKYCYSIPPTSADVQPSAPQPPSSQPSIAQPQEVTSRTSYTNSNYGNDNRGNKARNNQRRNQNQQNNMQNTRNYKSSSNDVRQMSTENMSRSSNRPVYASGANAYPQQGGGYRQRSNYDDRNRHDDRYRNDGYRNDNHRNDNYRNDDRYRNDNRYRHDDRYRNDYREPSSMFDSRNEMPPQVEEQQRKPPIEKPSQQSIFGQAKPVDTHSAQMAMWSRMETEKKGQRGSKDQQQPSNTSPHAPKEQPTQQSVPPTPTPPAVEPKLLTRKGAIPMKESPDEQSKESTTKRSHNPPTRNETQLRRINKESINRIVFNQTNKNNTSSKETGPRTTEVSNSQNNPKPTLGRQKHYRATRKQSNQSNATSKDENQPKPETPTKQPPVESTKHTPEVVASPTETAPSSNTSPATPTADNGTPASKAKKSKNNKKKKENAVGINRFNALQNYQDEE
ncbi:hypothetical protein M3Y95_00758000 [Aphelenchoides besseyi]|nr:hypothetical protein M3Y95_00758000 [Aphelenchoides besseyi]